MYFMDAQTKFTITQVCANFSECLFNARAWPEIVWQKNIFPKKLIKVVGEAGINVQRFSCKSQKEEEDWSMDLNKVMCRLTSLKCLKLKKCTLIYNWSFMIQTRLITHMYIDECVADQVTMIRGVNSLTNLKYFVLIRCRLMSAYNICQAVKYCLKLQHLDVRGSGRMKSVLACVILNKCTSIQKFFFSNLYTYDTMYDRLRWYRIARMKFKHVTFADDLYERVDLYSRTDVAVRQLLNIGKMLDKYGPKEE